MTGTQPGFALVAQAVERPPAESSPWINSGDENSLFTWALPSRRVHRRRRMCVLENLACNPGPGLLSYPYADTGYSSGQISGFGVYG